MKSKIILVIDNLDIIEKAKKVGLSTFLFPLKNYSVGFNNDFKIDDIKEEAFLLINRNLTNSDVDNLKSLLKDLPNNIKGIVFEDLALINILKDSNLIKIYNSKHLNCSSNSVNVMLNYVDSVILSTDLTSEEIINITKNSNKEICLYLFGLNQIMYSRRTLLSNYAKQYNLDNKNNLDVIEGISNQMFKVVENDYGTVFYTGKFYNALELSNLDDMKYGFINTCFLDDNNIDILLDNISNNNYNIDNMDIKTSKYNLDEKTYYKLPPKEGDNNV